MSKKTSGIILTGLVSFLIVTSFFYTSNSNISQNVILRNDVPPASAYALANNQTQNGTTFLQLPADIPHDNTQDPTAANGYNMDTNQQWRAIDQNMTFLHSIWRVVRIWGSDLHVVRGYYDDRPNSEKSVRFIVVSGNSLKNKLIKSTFYCHLWLTPLNESITVDERTVASKGKAVHYPQRTMKPIYGKIWYNTCITCPIPSTVDTKLYTVNHVSFSSKSDGEVRNVVPVLHAEKPEAGFKARVGMCLGTGALHGYLDDNMADWLIEWLELSQVLGISHFHITNGTAWVSSRMRQLLNYYEESGIVSIAQHPPPVENYKEAERAIGRDVADVAKRTALHDCFYSNMYRYEYIASLDLDEVIVPTTESTYKGLLGKVKACTKCKGEKPTQVYRSHMFCQYKEPSEMIDNVTNSNNVTTHNTISGGESLNSNSTESDNNSMVDDKETSNDDEIQLMLEERDSFNEMKNWDMRKVMMNPRLCVFAWTHGCLKAVKNAPLNVKDGHGAFVHHYRSECDIKRFAHHTADKDKYTKDKRIQKYMPEVRERVDSIRLQLGFD